MKEKIRIKGQLNGYAKWPLLMSVLLLIMNIPDGIDEELPFN